ncbi:hypothetical protein B0H10DRAFT_2056788, partial [Mycena sp. CBHHK59/15]
TPAAHAGPRMRTALRCARELAVLHMARVTELDRRVGVTSRIGRHALSPATSHVLPPLPGKSTHFSLPIPLTCTSAFPGMSPRHPSCSIHIANTAPIMEPPLLQPMHTPVASQRTCASPSHPAACAAIARAQLCMLGTRRVAGELATEGMEDGSQPEVCAAANRCCPRCAHEQVWLALPSLDSHADEQGEPNSVMQLPHCSRICSMGANSCLALRVWLGVLGIAVVLDAALVELAQLTVW